MEYLVIIVLAFVVPTYYELKIKKIREICAAERELVQDELRKANRQDRKEIFRKESPKHQEFD